MSQSNLSPRGRTAAGALQSLNASGERQEFFSSHQRSQTPVGAGTNADNVLAPGSLRRSLESILTSLKAQAAISQARAEAKAIEFWRTKDDGRRKFRRLNVAQDASVTAIGANRPCRIHDISPGGARIEMRDIRSLWAGGFVVLNLNGYGPVGSELRHLEDAEHQAGLMFMHSGGDQVSIANWLTGLHAPAAAH